MKTLFGLFTTLLLTTPLALAQQARKEILYVGTYSLRGSEGIYVFAFDRSTGALHPLQTVSNAKSPSFLALHPAGTHLYAVNEAAQNSGGVSAYSIDRATGKLQFLNEQSSGGAGPCHIAVDQTGSMALVSNYGAGSLTTLPIEPGGRLGTPTDTVRYVGSGPNKSRQEAPHIHSATVSPDNRFAYVADLGTDTIYGYALDPKRAQVTPAAQPFVRVSAGGGPRHLAIHPNGRYVYVVEELTSSVAVFARDAKTGSLRSVQDGVKALPADFSGQNTSADIHIDPSGRFLYQSNRGHNSLAIFRIGPDGRLTLTGHARTGGETPRNFWMDPQGHYVLVANQNADNVVVFRRDARTGQLTQQGQPIKVPAPVCLKMLTL